MGNCLFGELRDGDGVIKVITPNGGMMELYGPIRVGSITKEFPGQGIFRSQDLFWKPLCEYDELVGGESYYLLPLFHPRQGHVRSTSTIPTTTSTSYKISQHRLLNTSNATTQPFSNNGFWKVKLVITPQHLLHILSQQSRTEELIDALTTVAKSALPPSPPPPITFSTTTHPPLLVHF